MRRIHSAVADAKNTAAAGAIAATAVAAAKNTAAVDAIAAAAVAAARKQLWLMRIRWQ